MDPTLPSPEATPQQPQTVKEKVAETANEFVKNNYEGFLRRLINVIYAVLKFTKNGLLSMINMALNRE